MMGTAGVCLNRQDCSLAIDLSEECLTATPLSSGGFGWMWSGVRASVGLRDSGRYYFTCTLLNKEKVEMPSEPESNRHILRVGVSSLDVDINSLGEVHDSYGFGGTGKASSAGKFIDYGLRYSTGDEIGCAVDLVSNPPFVAFTLNGRWLGKAFDLFSRAPMFPHLLTKNIAFSVDFTSSFAMGSTVFAPWSSALLAGHGALGPRLLRAEECEVIMMVGLPASGKSWWVDQFVRAHPEKKYMVLGSNQVMDQMKVSGLKRSRNYAERFQELVDKAMPLFKTLLERAPALPHNYILDQTNVYPRARQRKMQDFRAYRRKAVVMVVDEQTLKQRAAFRERTEGKTVPQSAVDDMASNFVLPAGPSDRTFHTVEFAEEPQEAAHRIVAKMRAEANVRIQGAKKRSYADAVSTQHVSDVGQFGPSCGHLPFLSVMGGNYDHPRGVVSPPPAKRGCQFASSFESSTYIGTRGVTEKGVGGLPGSFLPQSLPESYGGYVGGNASQYLDFDKDVSGSFGNQPFTYHSECSNERNFPSHLLLPVGTYGTSNVGSEYGLNNQMRGMGGMGNREMGRYSQFMPNTLGMNFNGGQYMQQPNLGMQMRGHVNMPHGSDQNLGNLILDPNNQYGMQSYPTFRGR